MAQKTVQILAAGRSIGAILRHSTQTNVAVPVRSPMSLSVTSCRLFGYHGYERVGQLQLRPYVRFLKFSSEGCRRNDGGLRGDRLGQPTLSWAADAILARRRCLKSESINRSRQVSALEDRCNAAHRHTRGLLLTEQGKLHGTVHEVLCAGDGGSSFPNARTAVRPPKI